MIDPNGPMDEPADAGTGEGELCVLISTSCTTGWFDWVHGDLWMCPAGVLRQSRGLTATMAKYRRWWEPRLHPRERQRREEIAVSGPAPTWVPWTEVRRLTLKVGIIDHSIHIQRTDNRRVKFLWLVGDGDFELLETVLRAAIGDRLIVRTTPIG